MSDKGLKIPKYYSPESIDRRMDSFLKFTREFRWPLRFSGGKKGRAVYAKISHRKFRDFARAYKALYFEYKKALIGERLSKDEENIRRSEVYVQMIRRIRRLEDALKIARQGKTATVAFSKAIKEVDDHPLQ